MPILLLEITLNIEQWELVASCLPMTIHVARRKLQSIHVEEAVMDVGISTLIRCIELWDSTMGVKFSTYAYKALGNSYVIWNTKLKKRRIAEKAACSPSKDQNVMATDRRDYVSWLMSDLSTYQRMLLVFRFWAEMNINEISTKVGVPSRTVLRHIQLALKQCKEKTCCE